MSVGINKDQLRELITETLEKTGLLRYDDKRDVELLMLTAAAESHLGYYIKQIKGPALGIFQMEPATHDDIWDNYLDYNKNLAHTIMFQHNVLTNARPLKWNLAYAIIMARVHYLRDSKPIPPVNDVDGLAKYWKRVYNTHLGAGDWEKAKALYIDLA